MPVIAGRRGRVTRRARVLAMLQLAAIAPVLSQVVDTGIDETDTVSTETARATEWHLSIEDWQRYRSLMDGPRGLWSPTLDPITVLGIHATTDAERRRYAELLVMIEFQRVGQELKFQQAYSEAARRLFPTLMPVAGPDSVDPEPLVGVDRIAYVGSIDASRCPTCRAELARLLRLAENPSTPVLDLYLEDAEDDAALRAWAVAEGIEPSVVLAGRITLNHARESFSLPVRAEPVTAMRWQRLGGRWLPWDEVP